AETDQRRRNSQQGGGAPLGLCAARYGSRACAGRGRFPLCAPQCRNPGQSTRTGAGRHSGPRRGSRRPDHRKRSCLTRLAIMQPTFLPWLGYFALIDRVDRFVYLDDVQLSRQSWQTRNRLKGPQGPVMLGLPVARKPSLPMIRDARLAPTGFEAKLIATAQQLLGRAPFGDLAVGMLEHGLTGCGGSLAALNIAVIEAICDATGIDTPRSRASDLTITTQDRIERLVALCRATGCTSYLSPPGAAEYLGDGGAFTAAGVTLCY